MRDPNILLIAIAQVSATLVAVLGGFLLTYGLSYTAQFQQTKRRIALMRQQTEDFRATSNAKIAERDEFLESADRRKRDISRRLLMAHLTPDEAAAEHERLDDEIEASLNATASWPAEQVRRIEDQKADDAELLAAFDDSEDQLNRIRIGHVVLATLAMFGVALPIVLLPAQPSHGVAQWDFVPKIAFILLLALTLHVISILSVEPVQRHPSTPWDWIVRLLGLPRAGRRRDPR